MTDNRKHPRFCPNGLAACISIELSPPDEKLTFNGTVINMSYTGIKIKLSTPLNIDIPDSLLHISLTLPESGLPVTIRGMIKHLNNDSECGLQYTGKDLEHSIDNLMFECIKISDDTNLKEVDILN